MATIKMRSAMRVAVMVSALLMTVTQASYVFADAVQRPNPGGEMMQMLQDKDKVQIPKEEKPLPKIEQDIKKPVRAAVIGSKKPSANPKTDMVIVKPTQPNTNAVRRPTWSIIHPPVTPPRMAISNEASSTKDHCDRL